MIDIIIEVSIAVLVISYLAVNVIAIREDNFMVTLIVSSCILIAFLFMMSSIKRQYEETMDYCVPYIEREVLHPLFRQEPTPEFIYYG